ncbi:MAG: hypothetical protein JKY43_05180 [Phycisphaerales bacterium]|nr:hypothetical protein [Phycisphaerales bacterium]
MATSKSKTTLLLIATVIAATAMTACSPRAVDRTDRRPHTGMRGVAYKKLIFTLNEANALSYRANEHAQLMYASDEVDDKTKESAMRLVDDANAFADDIEWSLANNQRMTWHRSEMNRLWGKFKNLYPEDKSYAKGYTKWSVRKPTPKLRLKFNYDDNYGIERTKPRWNDLQPVIREFYETE